MARKSKAQIEREEEEAELKAIAEKEQGMAEIEFWQNVRSQTHWQVLEAKAKEQTWKQR